MNKIYDKINYKAISYVDTRPNILLVVLDDVGFADLGFTSSEISTPVMNSMAQDEILMTNFHVTPTCSPTRAIMLTGVDNHLNGFGTMNEAMADNQRGKPGYETYLNYDVVTVSSLLQDSGYHTYMSGKWHLAYGGVTPNVEEDWDELWIHYDPYSRGFEETFSGGIPGNHFSEVGIGPGHAAFYTRNGERVTLPDDFYSATSYTDYLLEFIDKNHDDGKPMFMYLPFWTSHFPLHAPEEYIEKYDGVYDKGWDEIRKERFEKQKELGFISKDLELPDRREDVPAWEELSPEEQAYEAKKMQIFAAMTDITDDNIGRVIDHLKEIGEYENTLIFIFSDNGPESAEVTKHAPIVGFAAEEYQEFLDQFDNTLENIGSETSNISLGAGWAQVGSSPLYREKTFVTEGGTRVPMVVKVPGESINFKTNSFSAVQDITPTILDYAQVEHPGNMYDGREIHSMSGKSLKPLFEGKLNSCMHLMSHLEWNYLETVPYTKEIGRHSDLYLQWEMENGNYSIFQKT
ncbi:MAG: arylsulfatase [Nanoarchaeota archaeon]|nr:arylsulfatase [Nanoarchaeota archaeon]